MRDKRRELLLEKGFGTLHVERFDVGARRRLTANDARKETQDDRVGLVLIIREAFVVLDQHGEPFDEHRGRDVGGQVEGKLADKAR
jgi:hypothetical protein